MERRRALLAVALPLTLLLLAGVVLLMRGPPEVVEGANNNNGGEGRAEENENEEEGWLQPIELSDEKSELGAWYVTREGVKEEDARLLVVLHGCGRSAVDWFVLPEEQAIVRAALDGPFAAVLAVDSRDALWHCWRPGDPADTAAVLSAIAALTRTVCGPDTRCLAGGTVVLGTSSGGTMATALLRAPVPHLVGAVALVSPGDAPTLEALSSSSSSSLAPSSLLPRVAFVHMAGDTVFATPAVVAKHVAALNAAQPGTARAFLCAGVRADRAFFAQRVPGVTPAASATLWAVLVDAGLVDADTGRATVPAVWDAEAETLRLAERCAARLPAFPWADHAYALVEELKVLQNVHETTREHVAEALAWTLRLE